MNGIPGPKEKPLKNSLRKSDTRKDVSVAFHKNLNKIVEVETDEKVQKSRPKSANYCDSYEKNLRRRPSSSEPFLGRGTSDRFKWDPGNKLAVCCCCWREGGRDCSSLLDFRGEDSWNYFRHQPRRRTRSNPNVSKTALQKCERIFDSERDIYKMKRSLRLLGFELSDFGIGSDRGDAFPAGKPRQRLPAFSTKITNRSISLDSLREAVRRAWLDDRLDESHRRVLARAAYEEWYFRKEREIWEKREEERINRQKAEESFLSDFQRKKAKSEEEFKKWLQRKRIKRKERQENARQQQVRSFSRLRKSEEESEKAFLKWKKSKEKELMKRKIEKNLEEERKKETERQKYEKKIIAEKAFQQWKAKLEEQEKLMEEKRRKQRTKQEMEEKRRREEGSRISFEMWKAAKDEQIRQTIKHIREMERIAREERQAQMEERMYEAEQAFEEWLERVDLRRQKHMTAFQKNVPWIPV